MRLVRFDDFELNMDLFSLTCNGKEVEIGRRTIDLLICLIENRDRVVDLEFLRAEVWDSAALSAAAIPTCVLELRRALRDDSSNPKFILSVRGRGYRFIGRILKPQSPQQSSTPAITELAFSGRSQELALMRARLRTTIAEARGHVMLLKGEAGIGKSRLLDEFLASVGSRVEYFEAKISTVEGAPPFWPWTRILRNALSRYGRTNQTLVEQAQGLSTVFPEIRSAVMPTHAGVAKLDRFSLLMQWARTIRCLIGNRPLVLAFEDIHRADIDSLMLLFRLADELRNDRLLIVATHRPPAAADEVADAISDIAAIRHATTIELTPLDERDIRSMLDPMTPDRDEVCRALAERSLGNAFYVTHLIRYLAARPGQESGASAISQLPVRGREIVSRQLSDLPDETREALLVASVVGDEFSITLLKEILEISTEALSLRLAPAVRAWLVREDGSEFQFSHSLLRDALYQTYESCERQRIHLRLARELSCRSDSHLKLDQISDHFEAAMPLAPHAEARRFAVLAGREAASRFAFTRSKALFLRAYRIVLDDPNAGLGDRCVVMQELARSMLYEGDRNGARMMLLEAMQFARRIGAANIFAACALDLVPDFLSIEVGQYDSALVRRLDEALASTPEADFALRAQLLARMAQAQQWGTRAKSTESLAIKALELARASADPEALTFALSARAESLQGPARAGDRLKLVLELGDVAKISRSLPTVLIQKTRLIAVLLELGDIKGVEHENEGYRELAAETGLPQYKWYPVATDSMLAMMRGEIDYAERLSVDYSDAAGNSPDQNFRQTYACQYVAREIERNRSRDVLGVVRNFAVQHKTVLSWSAALAWLQWDSGMKQQAVESTRLFRQEDIVAMSREAGGGIGVATLAEVSASLGIRDKSEFLYDLIKPLTHRCATAGYGVAYYGSFSRYAGLLALSLGETEAGIDHLTQAVDQELSRGALGWWAYSEIDILIASKEHGGIDIEERRARTRELESRIEVNRLLRARRVLEASGLLSNAELG